MWRNQLEFWIPVYLCGSFIFYLSCLSHIEWVSKGPAAFVPSMLLKHVMEYTILGLLLLRAFRNTMSHRSEPLFLTVFTGGLYGVTDEIHQYFTPYRVCSLYDMLADSIGSACGCVLMLMACYIPIVSKQCKKIHQMSLSSTPKKSDILCIIQRFNKRKVPALIFKTFGVSTEDIDILTRDRQHFMKSASVLVSLGYSPPAKWDSCSSDIGFAQKSLPTVELHTHVGWRGIEHISPKEVWGSSVERVVEGRKFREPCLEHQLLITILHAIYGHFRITQEDLETILALTGKTKHKMPLPLLNIIEKAKRSPKLPYYLTTMDKLMAHLLKLLQDIENRKTSNIKRGLILYPLLSVRGGRRLLPLIDPILQAHSSQRRLRTRHVRLIVFSGTEGSGKTSHALATVKWLRSKGIRATYLHLDKMYLVKFVSWVFRKLGGGEKWRTLEYMRNEIIGSTREDDWLNEFRSHASRMQRRIRPYLHAFDNFLYMSLVLLFNLLLGRAVVCDRYYYDHLVQMNCWGYNIAFLEPIYLRFVPKPDIGFVLVTDPVKSYKRDMFPLKFCEEIKEKYVELAKNLQYKVIDTTKPFEDVQFVIERSIGSKTL